jgi:hypothetical protein
VGEKDTFSEKVEVGSAEHLSLEVLDAADVALDCA